MEKAIIDKVYQNHISIINNLKPEFRRDFIDEIDFSERMIALKGARGVGKTTLLLQYIKEQFKTSTQALYISMDSLQVSNLSIYEIAEYHSMQGGTHLFVDEIHKYPNWSIELKNIYDALQNISVIFSSSSILQIYNGYADLSRRVVTYQLNGLSFREYVEIETKIKLPKYTLANILENHEQIAATLLQQIKPFVHFKTYLEYGYYPFYLQSKKTYFQKIDNVINVILEVDLPYILDINIHNVNKLKRLIKIIAGAVPFQPNITKLAETIGVTRNTATQYLYYLHKAEIINMLINVTKSYSQLTKPEKIFLQNPNFCYALNEQPVNIGTVREVFFYNQVAARAAVHHSKEADFLVNEKYIFEVGGANKSYAQILGIENSFLAVDDIEIGHKNKIPLWLFGFLY